MTHELAPLIDHTNLYPDALDQDLERLVDEAETHGFHAVCVYPDDVGLVVDRSETIQICSVVGFPHGRDPSRIKQETARHAVQQGADEIDMVIHQGALRQGEHDRVRSDIEAVREAVPGTLKVILETCNLTPVQIREGCRIAGAAGADFVKTSTGFGEYGARVDDVAAMAEAIDRYDLSLGIKASGGIKHESQVYEFIEEAELRPDPSIFRIGASRSLQIIGEGDDR
ncbi:MAG: deoxyribose-phosphate aldolase [Candidatus Nanohaloarchaeota archaeon QJJ-5]|nr:deoxyribose-phosphate aldolase [Candidatus Nanohaloarchaeota archaeon QJJ-5]